MIDKIPESENEILKVFDDPEYEIRNGHIEELFLRFNFDKLTSLPLEDEILSVIIEKRSLESGRDFKLYL